eukprot:TRINITY_DN16118_c2_g2_i1.p1 TRINITY_DN16118_c2_g2~~TRINITY_DN16118_c2_g2_i1.p1  ORF type:complete len:1054 (+),score=291.84 TRINITY_DN16118_c2_g2_i1:80-3241(+)
MARDEHVTLQETQEQLAKTKTINVLFSVLAATFVSTSASIGGGLVMYFESLHSLHRTMEETSAMEMGQLEARISALVYSAEDDAVQMWYTLRSGLATVDNDPETWRNAMLNLQHGMLSARPWAYGMGLAMVDKDPGGGPGDFTYVGMWRDPLQNGSQVITTGLRWPAPEGHPEHVGPPTNTTAHRLGFTTDAETGAFTERRAKMGNVLKYQTWSRDPLAHGFEVPPPRDAGRYPMLHPPKYTRPRKIASWRGPDGVPYNYASFDNYFTEMPPAPHPWSGFHSAIVIGWYTTAAWESAVRAQLGEKQSESEIVVYDAANMQLYVSTAGPVLDDVCIAAWWKAAMQTPAQHCVLGIQNSSAAVQEAHRVLQGTVGEFHTITAAGADYFARRTVFPWNPDVAILWLRSTSSVQDEVNRALMILVLFCLSVAGFDGFLTFVEVKYVAVPLKNVADAINAIGHMDTETARVAIRKPASGAIMVKEMHTVVCGIVSTLQNLQDYKSFLPAAAKDLDIHALDNVSPPAGDVAIVFTDIVKSTVLWEAVPQEMVVALDAHFRVLRTLLARHRGYEVKTIGDSLMASFQSPGDALAFCVEAQVQMNRQEWPEGLELVHPDVQDGEVFSGLLLRVGAHWGPVAEEVNPLTGRSDYRSATVNKAARLEGVGLPGMVVISEELKNAAAGHPYTIVPYGRRELKGIGQVQLHFAVSGEQKARHEFFMKELAKNPNASSANLWDTAPLSPKSSYGSARGSARGSKASVFREKSVHVEPRGGVKSLQLAAQPQEKYGAYAFTRYCVAEREGDDNNTNDAVFNSMNVVLARLLGIVGMTSGKVSSLVGCSVGVSWGVLSRVEDPGLQCLRFCGSLSWQLRASDVSIEAGAAVGPLLHGVVGTHTQRYHTIAGAGGLLAERLAGRCEGYDAPLLVVIAGGVPEALRHCCTPVDVAAVGGRFGPVATIEEVRENESRQLASSWHHDVEIKPDGGGDDDLRAALTAAAAANEPLPGAFADHGVAKRLAARLAEGKPAALPVFSACGRRHSVASPTSASEDKVSSFPSMVNAF